MSQDGWISDRATRHLQRVTDLPDLSGTPYEIDERIGQGGMGVVYRANDTKLHRQVALKVLSVPVPSERARARMLKEARILARLEHPGIVPVHDVGTLADGRAFYAMKLVQGRRLDESITSGQGLRERLRIFERICEAVAFAHAHGVIHRDLKPSNVMLGPFGEVLVMDWGVAKLKEEDEPLPGPEVDTPAAAGADTLPLADAPTRPGTVLGTPGYMAPEQASGRLDLVDQRSDVYALGVILADLLTGLGRSTPRRIAAVATKATSEDPEDRYAGVESLAGDVGRFLDGDAVLAHRETVFERTGRILYRYRTPLLILATYLVVRMILLFFGA